MKKTLLPIILFFTINWVDAQNKKNDLIITGGWGINVISLCIGLAIFGATVGNLLMLQPLIIAETFGVRDYAKIFSVTNLMTSWGTATGPALLGVVYAGAGNHYSASYLVAAAAGVLGIVIFLAGGKLHPSRR